MRDRAGTWALLLIAGCALFAGCAPAPNPVEFSPDGQRLVFPWGNQGRLHEVHSDGTGLRVLPDTENAAGPRWSPREETLAFEQEGTLVFYDPAHQQIVQRIERGMAPAVWAPDGQRVGVFRKNEGHVEATWYQVPGWTAGRAIPLPVQQVSAAQTPQWLEARDGMAFMAANGDTYNLYTVEGDDVYRITSTGDVLGFGLTGDGTHLVWARRNPQSRDSGLTLWSYDLRLRSVRKLPFPARLTTPGERQAQNAPVVVGVQFAPAAERLALVVERPREAVEILTCALDGSGLKRVERSTFPRTRSKTGEMAYDSLSPYWSADGQRLAVIKSGKHTGIRIYGPEGDAGVKLPLPVADAPGGG